MYCQAVNTRIFLASIAFILVQVALQGSYRYDRSASSIRAVRIWVHPQPLDALALRCMRLPPRLTLAGIGISSMTCTRRWTP